MFMGPWSCCAYLLNPQFRGENLTPLKRRTTIEFFLATAWPLICGDEPPPPLDDIMDFLALSGSFEGGARWIGKGGATTFWKVFTDLPLAKAALIVSGLPSSSASVERLWSFASFMQEGRVRLTEDHFVEQVYVRWNNSALHLPVCPSPFVCLWNTLGGSDWFVYNLVSILLSIYLPSAMLPFDVAVCSFPLTLPFIWNFHTMKGLPLPHHL